VNVTVRIGSHYADGHSSVRQVTLEAPTSDGLEAWWEDVVYPETGDGHGERFPKLGHCYDAEVIAGDPLLVGLTREWVGS
jgi:hypothetical protein